jgi:signal transduction histidine kinase
MGGHIHVERELAKGTTFSVLLPTVVAELERPVSADPNSPDVLL